MNCPSCGLTLVGIEEEEGLCMNCDLESIEKDEPHTAEAHDPWADVPENEGIEDIRVLYAKLQASQPEFPIDELRFVTRGPIPLGVCVETDPYEGIARRGIVTECIPGHTGYRIKAAAWHVGGIEVRHG